MTHQMYNLKDYNCCHLQIGTWPWAHRRAMATTITITSIFLAITYLYWAALHCTIFCSYCHKL